MTRLAIKILLLGGFAGLAAGAAGASPASSNVPELTVRFSADVLATDSGARSLYHRIARAAEQVCPNSPYDLLVSEEVRKCRQQAITGAVNKINNQRLAAVHAAYSSKSS
jgi:UrcA family protein